MARNELLFLLYTLGIFQEGLTALIQTKRAVMAAAGEHACLQCQLTVPKEVHQVTWQKELPDGERNIATFSKYTGRRVNPGFQGKVEFKDAGLQNSSIVIREVTEQDEGCYRCLFNTYPEGALMSSTCLRLYELHGPFLHVMESNSSEEAVMSCLATARPAPTVTIRVLNLELKSSNVAYSNKNGTVTITAMAVLQRSLDNSTEVECEVQVPSVIPKKTFETIPEVKKAPSSDDSESTWIIPTVCMVVLSVVSCILLGLVKRRHHISQAVKDPEVIKTPVKPAETQFTTPLIQHQDEKLGARLRSSVLKEAGIKSPCLSPLCKRELSRLFGDKNSPVTPAKI